MKRQIFLMAWLAATMGVLGTQTSQANGAAERVQEAAEVLDQIMDAPDKGIPQELLADAHCIAIIPSMKRGGFVVGAHYGKGVVSCRGKGGTGWTPPSTIRMEGGSFGFQIGGSATDVVLLVMNKDGAEKLMKSEFTLGGDLSVAAGPVGRSADAETDAYFHAKILAYSRSRGLFAGAVLEGQTLRSDDDDNRQIYGRPVEHEDILKGKVETPSSAGVLIAALNSYSAYEE